MMGSNVNGYAESLSKIEMVLGANLETVERLIRLKEKMLKFNSEKEYETKKVKEQSEMVVA